MTVQEYLDFTAELKGISRDKRESSVEEVLKLAKLMDVRGRLIRNLSKGYRQRVGLAQAVLGFPDIIILDEPTVGLDPKQIIEIRELIRKLAKDHTVILSSHILAEVREVCDYIMIISKGRLVASDTPDNLEHLMDDSETVEILAKTEPSRLREILSSVNEISGIKTEKRADGTTYATLEVKEHKDIREKVFFAFAGANCPLLMLNTNRASLEEIFLELTQGETGSKLLSAEREEDETDAGDL